jgi:methyl-accepting chemotaxis protein-1 (serine sensor receptor)
VTQQNAALFEEARAASQAMQEQAVKLAELVGIFTLAGSAVTVHPAALVRIAKPAAVRAVKHFQR